MTQQTIMSNISFVVMLFLIIILVIANIVEKAKAAKREKDLLNRIMSRSLDDYTVNTVRLNPEKPEFIGTVGQKNEEETDTLPVD